MRQGRHTLRSISDPVYRLKNKKKQFKKKQKKSNLKKNKKKQ